MKKYIIFAFMTVVLGLGNAHAQSISVRAKVPFDFVAGAATFHGRTYRIEPADVSAEFFEFKAKTIRARLP